MTSKATVNRLLYFLTFCLFTFLLLPGGFIHYPKAGIDSSWALALNMAYKYKLIFGRDFEFTYGPLGIIRTRMPLGVSWFFYLLFDVYILTTELLLLRRILKRHFNVLTVLFLFLVIYLCTYEEPGSWTFLLGLFYLLTMFRGPVRLTHGMQAALFAVITFYFKSSVGIVAFFLYLGILLYILIRRRIDARSFIFLILFFAGCIAAGAWLLNVDLKGYMIGGLHIISGYNDAMFLPITDTGIKLLCISLAVLFGTACFGFWRLVTITRERKLFKEPDDLIVYGVMTFVIFFYYKSGFTRSDVPHNAQFFRGAVLFIGLLFFFGHDDYRWRRSAAAWCWLVLVCTLAVSSLNADGSRQLPRLVTLSFIPEKIYGIHDYFSELFHYDQEVTRQQKLTQLPNPYRDLIGSAPTDIIPWEISTIYFNGLTYDPRPIMQTYSAYDGYLDSLNAAKYASPGGPQYVLFSSGGTDNRFPWFDEARTKLELVNRYVVAGSLQGELVLRKSPDSVLRPDGQETASARLGEDIPIRHYDGLRFTRFFIRFSPLGRLRRMVYQSPQLNIVVTLGNGATFTYKAPKPVLEDGLIINKYLDSKEEFQALLQGAGQMTTDIRSIRIEPDSTASCFKPEITMTSTFYKIEIPAYRRSHDSTELASLFSEHKPAPLAPALIQPDTLVASLELFRHDRWFVIVKGWAYHPGEDNSHDTVSTILASRDHVYELPTPLDSSTDLLESLGRKDVGNIRFSAMIATCNLAPGQYELGLASRRPGDGKRRVAYTGQFVLVRNNYRIEHLSGVTPAQATADTGLQWNFDRAEVHDGRIVIDGWALLHVNTPFMTTHILFSNKNDVYRVSTDVLRRDDVASLHKDTSLRYCGFSLEIPGDSLPNGQYDLGIEVTGTHGEKLASRRPGDGKGRVLHTGQFVLVRDNYKIEHLSGMTPAQATADTGLQWNFDRAEVHDGRIVIDGWALLHGNTPFMTTHILFSNKNDVYRVSTDVLRRDDVASLHKDTSLRYCGFSLEIPRGSLPIGQYDLGIEVIGTHGEKKIAFSAQRL